MRTRRRIGAALLLVAATGCASGGGQTETTDGAAGATGAAGSSGAAGTTGAAGSTAGAAGSSGAAGTTGAAGSTAGAAGAAGLGGSAAGTAGATGAAGNGVAGKPGVAGRGGTSGASGAGGGAGSAGRGGAAGSGGASACDPGSTTTVWATSCPTAPATACVAGDWTDPGSTTNDPLVCESAHFAVHSPAGTITAQQCMDATNTLETMIWPTFFGSPIFFPEPYCSTAKKYKASIVVHSDYGLTGGGWGSGYMGMWVGPGATADHWGLAHEFTHAVQSQTKGLACGGAASNNTCGWLYESHANWHAHQLPEYRSNVHCSEMLPNAPHLYLGSTRDRYCNWQFMEYLKDKACYQAVNDIWNAPTPSSDPFTNIAATRGWTTSQLNDFFGEWAMHNVTWDYQNPPPTTGTQGAAYRSAYAGIGDTSKVERRLRLTRLEQLDADNRRYVVHTLQAPQRWGYNVIRLYPDPGATSVTVSFRGVVQSAASSDWRWGLVATNSGITSARYSALQRGADGQITFCVNAGEPLFLVVVGTPSVQQKIVWDQLYPSIYRYPYMIAVAGAQPDGFQTGAPAPSANGARWSNGGGWVASGASVAQGAYVGPLAAVLGGTVGATARIEDHAIITAGTVSGGIVGGLTILPTGMTVGGGKVALAWPYGPGWFERPQSISGTAQLLGDLELRGANLSKTSGAYCGFVDDTISSNCAGAEVTIAPPYTWRD